MLPSDAFNAPIQPDPNDPMPLLDMYFEPPMLRWIAACALYPTLHWDLTLWLGNQVSVIGNRILEKKRGKISNPNSSPDDLCTFQNLRELTRLSWFIEGEIPDAVRAKLLDWFEQNDKTLLQELRLALATELGKNAPPTDYAAFEPFRMTVAVNEWLATTNAEKKKQLEKEIADLLERGVEPDFVVLKYLDTPRSPLHFEVPKSWRKFVYNGGVRSLGFLRDLKDLGWLLPLFLVGLLGCFYSYNFIGGCSKDKIVSLATEGGKTHYFCLDDTLSRLTYKEQLIHQAFKSDSVFDLGEVDKLFNNDNDLKGLSSSFSHLLSFGETSYDVWEFKDSIRRNIAIDFYNRAKQEFEQYVKNKKYTCILLNYATDFDSLDKDIKVAQALLCGKINIKTQNQLQIAPNIYGSVMSESYSTGGSLEGETVEGEELTSANVPEKPIEGVQITGTNVNTRTDAQGKYSLKLPLSIQAQSLL